MLAAGAEQGVCVFAAAAASLLDESFADCLQLVALLGRADHALGPHGGTDKQHEALTKFRDWAEKRVARCRALHSGSTDTDAPAMEGPLQKRGGFKKVMWQQRWVELRGQTLRYFDDEARTGLCGELFLDGCEVIGVGSVKNSTYDVRTRLLLGNGPVEALEFSVTNALHCVKGGKGKDKHGKVYNFSAPTVKEASRWMRKLREASRPSPCVSEVLCLVRKFDGTSLADYQNIIQSLVANQTILTVPVAWARFHASHHVDEERLVGLGAPTMADVSMAQLSKDTQRDTIKIDGETLHQLDGAALLALLVARIDCKMQCGDDHGEACGGLCSLGHRGASGNVIAPTQAVALVAYARKVLTGSSRTQCGGDAYAAANLIFSSEHVVLCPDATFQSPINLEIRLDDGVGDLDGRVYDKFNAMQLRRIAIERNLDICGQRGVPELLRSLCDYDKAAAQTSPMGTSVAELLPDDGAKLPSVWIESAMRYRVCAAESLEDLAVIETVFWRMVKQSTASASFREDLGFVDLICKSPRAS